jgi:hypothetical protein
MMPLTLMMPLLLLTLLSCAGPVAGQQQQQWAGTVSFDDAALKTVGAPLNVTVSGATASATWRFTGEACREQHEPSLSFATAGGTASLLGCGAANCSGAQNFYSFVGESHWGGAGSDSINGTVYHPPYPGKKKDAVGTFSIAKVSATNKQRPPQCKGGGTPSPAPPHNKPPEGPNPPALWPAPMHYRPAPPGGNSTAFIDPAALHLTCTGSADACADTVAPAFARGKAWALSLADADSDGATLRSVIVRISSAPPLQLDVNESYTLQVSSSVATITAATQWCATFVLALSELYVPHFIPGSFRSAGERSMPSRASSSWC